MNKDKIREVMVMEISSLRAERAALIDANSEMVGRIQELEAANERKDARVAALEAENARLKAENANASWIVREANAFEKLKWPSSHEPTGLPSRRMDLSRPARLCRRS